MNYFQKWDALKSVKYIPAAPVNHARAVRSSGGANALHVFPLNINRLCVLTSRQGAFS